VTLYCVEEALEQHHVIVAVNYSDATWMVLLENAGAIILNNQYFITAP
jgi:hypothetical protein